MKTLTLMLMIALAQEQESKKIEPDRPVMVEVKQCECSNICACGCQVGKPCHCPRSQPVVVNTVWSEPVLIHYQPAQPPIQYQPLNCPPTQR